MAKKKTAVETNSSGPDCDKLNSREDRLQADPALAPELALADQPHAGLPRPEGYLGQ